MPSPLNVQVGGPYPVERSFLVTPLSCGHRCLLRHSGRNTGWSCKALVVLDGHGCGPDGSSAGNMTLYMVSSSCCKTFPDGTVFNMHKVPPSPWYCHCILCRCVSTCTCIVHSICTAFCALAHGVHNCVHEKDSHVYNTGHLRLLSTGSRRALPGPLSGGRRALSPSWGQC